MTTPLARLPLLAVLLAAAGCGGSGPAPETPARDDLASTLAAVEARFRDAESVTVEALVGNSADGPRYFLRTTWARPALYRQERWDGDRPEGEPASLRVSDGRTLRLYFPSQKKYYEMETSPEDLDREPLLLGFTRDGGLWVKGIEAGREEELVFGSGILAMPIAGGGALALEADAAVGGRGCRVISYRVGAMVQTFAVAKDDATPVRFTLESRSEHKGKTFTTTAVAELVRVDTSARPDLAAFSWSPPEGATRAAKAGEDKLLPAGGAAPAFRLADAAGHAVSLSDFKGKVVLLNFWFLG